ncbi:hypothetical protein GEMRC1_010562 [Eukaryota sp. GEM-RC1]
MINSIPRTSPKASQLAISPQEESSPGLVSDCDTPEIQPSPSIPSPSSSNLPEHNVTSNNSSSSPSPRNLKTQQMPQIEQVSDPSVRNNLMRDLDSTVRAGITYGRDHKTYRRRLDKLSDDIKRALSSQNESTSDSTSSSVIPGVFRLFIILHLFTFYNPTFFSNSLSCDFVLVVSTNSLILLLSLCTLICSSCCLLMKKPPSTLTFAIFVSFFCVLCLGFLTLAFLEGCLSFDSDLSNLISVIFTIGILPVTECVFSLLLLKSRR